ncbi:Nephrin-like 13 [Homarus americanus]|uniref:Nephrin-like 13 n=1 Tax=Homarus americanus TaxID=6706 RepID=A0A8J5JGA6_HOMAM|nr:Nephrin-like 13 [Homarus americanus]
MNAPGPPVITGYETGEVLVAGEQRTLICQVVGGRPRPWVTWYRHGRPLNHASTHILRDPEESSSTNTASTSSSSSEGRAWKGVRIKQVVRATQEEDGAVYECRVSSDLLPRPLTTNVTLTVHLVAAGQLFSLTCRTSPANPPATLTWHLQGSRVSTGTTEVSEHEGGGWVSTSQLARTQLMTQATADCQATHPAAKHSISYTHLIAVIKRPGWPEVEVVEGGEVKAGEQMTVLCTSRGGNPPPTLTLFKAGQKVTSTVEEREDGLTKARAVLQVTAADNGQQLTCHVSNPATSTPMAAHTTINILFPAWEVSGWVSPGRVEAGEVATLTCEATSSVPPSTITWHTTGAPLGEATVTHSQGLYGGTNTRSEVSVRTMAEDNGRTFTCEAENGLGVSLSTNVSLNVMHGPVWVWAPSGTLDVVEDEDLTITALAAANPGPGELSDGGSGQLTLLRVDRHMSGDYTVISRTSHSAINSSFVINVQYGPEDVLAAERVTVDEDGAATVLCSATGNPTPNITWTKNSDNTSLLTVLASGVGKARLVVEWASRADTGIYHCHAYNIVASYPPLSTAIVVTQEPTSATTNTQEEEMNRSWAHIGGSGWLDCRVKAAPAPTFRWTTSNNRVVSNSKKYFIHVPQLVDKVIEWSSLLEIRSISIRDYINYTCTAHNSQGSYAINFTLGYTVRYQATDAQNYEYVDVPGNNSTTTKITNLTPGLVEEVASSSSVEGQQPRMPLLILLLISLTATALLVLNVAIIVCFVRRRAMKRNISASSSKTTALEIYTPTSGAAASGDELPLTSFSDIPPPEYQSLDCQTREDDCEQTSLISPHINVEPPEPLVTTPTIGTSPRSGSTSPLLNGGISVQNNDTLLENTKLSPTDTVTNLTPGSPSKQERKMSKDSITPVHSSNTPDVCPVTTSSCEPLLQQQESFNTYSEDDQGSLSSHHSNSSYGFESGQLRPKLYSSYQPRLTTQVIYHGQPHIQQQLEQQQQQQQQQHYQQSLPCCQQISPSMKDKQLLNPISSLHSHLNPSRLSTSTSSCCDATCRQSYVTDTPVGYATLQPRRSCLKASQCNTLQRSHSDHNYTYNSLQCVYHNPVMELNPDICCQNSFCSNPQLCTQQSQRSHYERAQEFPIYLAKSRPVDRGCTRHNSDSGHCTYRNTPPYEPKHSTVPPDLCKVEPSSAKRVGWKEIVPDSPGRGTLASRGSTDTSTSSTTSTVTLGPARYPQHQHCRNNSERNLGMETRDKIR